MRPQDRERAVFLADCPRQEKVNFMKIAECQEDSYCGVGNCRPDAASINWVVLLSNASAFM